MRRLTIIVASGDAGRLRAALEVASTEAALDRPARIFLQSDAAPLLRSADPALLHMLSEALALGVSVTACQTGLAAAALAATELPPGIDTGGLIELLAGSEDDQLLMA